MKLELKVSGIDGVVATLRSLPPEIVSKRGGPVRSALRKGAQVIRKQALANLKVSVANAPRYSTGLSAKNLRIARIEPPQGIKGEAVRIFMKAVRYPDGRKRRGRAVTTYDAAWMLEYGWSKQPAEPWFRPAVAAKTQEATATVEVELRKGIDRIVRKLATKNNGR